MRLKIRCDGESEKFCKIFWELNKALLVVANLGAKYLADTEDPSTGTSADFPVASHCLLCCSVFPVTRQRVDHGITRLVQSAHRPLGLWPRRPGAVRPSGPWARG